MLGSSEGLLSTTDLFPLSSNQKPVSSPLNIFLILKNGDGEGGKKNHRTLRDICMATLQGAGPLLSGWLTQENRNEGK